LAIGATRAAAPETERIRQTAPTTRYLYFSWTTRHRSVARAELALRDISSVALQQWSELICHVRELSTACYVRDGSTRCMIDCYRDSSVTQHAGANVADAADRAHAPAVRVAPPQSFSAAPIEFAVSAREFVLDSRL
jgi:hypothetical protein